MEIKQNSDHGILYVTLYGRLDTMTAPQAEIELKTQIKDEIQMEIDFEHLEYISSAGLRVMLSLGKIMDQRGGTIKMHHMNEEVLEVFEITGMCDLFEIAS